MARIPFRRVAATLGLAGILLGSATPALASMQTDNAVQLTNDDITNNTVYSKAQPVSGVYENKAVYGKLLGDVPVDVYSVKPEKDGQQTISLLGFNDASQSASTPTAIFVDPTDATTAQQLGIPLPNSTYHGVVVTAADTDPLTKLPTLVKEPVLMKSFRLFDKQTFSLKKDTVYYILVLDPSGQKGSYALKFGTGQAWGGADFFKHFGTWFRVETNSFAGSSPFTFAKDAWGFLIFMLGLIVLMGAVITQEIFSALANRSKPAGYVLIKMQPYSRIVIWVGLWFTLMGGYIFFDRLGWTGLPFVMGLLFLLILANMLYLTLRLSAKISGLEVIKKEATIPFALRKRLFFSSLVSLFTYGAFLTFLVMYLNR